MPSKYIISDHQAPHFLSMATVEWVDVFTRPLYKDIVVDSLRYCQEQKGMVLYAWVIMTNHLHLIAAAKEGGNLSNIIRDFKRHTSTHVFKAISDNPQESRRDWMRWIFVSAGKRNSNNKNHQLWQQDNRPIELSTNEMMDQRLEYLHQNPVEAGIVHNAEDYVYSSAIDYAGGKGLLDVEWLG